MRMKSISHPHTVDLASNSSTRPADSPLHRSERATALPHPRLAFVDNLRWTMIVLVISMHSVDTYSPLGNWYFQDRAPLTSMQLLCFAAWQMYLQSFFMGLLFFISGTFVPGSLSKKGAMYFVRSRSIRLGLPVLFYMFILGPFTEYYVSRSWSSTEPTSFAHEWIKHIRNGEFLQESGPLWFCLALLVFCLAYVLARTPLTHWQIVRSSASKTSNAFLLFALIMSAGTFLVRALLPRGFSVLNLHLGDFVSYTLLFAAGISVAEGQWLESVPYKLGVRWLLIGLPVGFVVWLMLLRQTFSTTHWAYLFSGWHWQNAVYSIWESFSCVSIGLGLLVLYRKMVNTQGKVRKFFSDNAFCVYVFHPPIVIGLARTLVALHISPLLKALLLTSISVLASFVLSAAVFRRIPLLRAIL